jgi:hypothetical protein
MSSWAKAGPFPLQCKSPPALTKSYCQFLPVCLVPASVLQLDVQVQRHVRSIHSVAAFVGTFEALLDLHCQAPILLAVFDLVEFLVLLADALRVGGNTSTSLTCRSSSASFSERSLMMAKLISFLRYFFQNSSL